MRVVRLAMGAAVGMALLYGFWASVPATQTPFFEEETPSQIGTMERTAADLEERVGDDGQVFTVRTNYYALSDVDHAGPARIWGVVGDAKPINSSDPDSLYQQQRRRLTRQLSTGEIDVVVMSPRTGAVIRNWNSTQQAFREHFCRVEPTPPVYESLSTNIYEYHIAPPSNCTNTIQTELGW